MCKPQLAYLVCSSMIQYINFNPTLITQFYKEGVSKSRNAIWWSVWLSLVTSLESWISLGVLILSSLQDLIINLVLPKTCTGMYHTVCQRKSILSSTHSITYKLYKHWTKMTTFLILSSFYESGNWIELDRRRK